MLWFMFAPFIDLYNTSVSETQIFLVTALGIESVLGALQRERSVSDFSHDEAKMLFFFIISLSLNLIENCLW